MTWLNRMVAVLAAACCTGGCTQKLDWREFVAEGTDLRVTFPCRPDSRSRVVSLAGTSVQMNMLTCPAGGSTYAVSHVSLSDPARIAAVLAELRTATISNVQGGEPLPLPLQIKGMTPNEQASRVSLAGRLPDGAAVREYAAFFTRGTKVYQAVVIGERPAADDVEVFFAGLAFTQ